MYRLVLCVLIAILGFAIGQGFLRLGPYLGSEIILSTLVLVVVSWVTNKIFAKVFEAPTNVESVFITALILALVISPARNWSQWMFLIWAAILAQSSKFIMAIGKKHVFNPVAIAVVLTAWGIGQSASWWVGNPALTPIVIIGGLLIVRKIQREEMIWTFLMTALVIILGFSLAKGSSPITVIGQVTWHSSLFFFAFVMLTEPLTTPPTKWLQIIYSGIVGLLFAPQIHIGGIYSTPEMALIMGNLMSYWVSPKTKLVLRGGQKIEIAKDTYDFVFTVNKKINFIPGQYMEWTLPHSKTDDRGNRRYFTLASSPTENNVRIGVKFNNPSSSFKKEMLALSESNIIGVAQLAGDFVMPEDPTVKLVFVAGGIGITPFRSMIKYMIDTKQKRDVIIFYSNKTAKEIAYKEVFDQAQRELNIKVYYVNTEVDGRIAKEMIQKNVPDFSQRVFYLSGPHEMVESFNNILAEMGVRPAQIVKDYFPGF